MASLLPLLWDVLILENGAWPASVQIWAQSRKLLRLWRCSQCTEGQAKLDVAPFYDDYLRGEKWVTWLFHNTMASSSSNSIHFRTLFYETIYFHVSWVRLPGQLWWHKCYQHNLLALGCSWLVPGMIFKQWFCVFFFFFGKGKCGPLLLWPHINASMPCKKSHYITYFRVKVLTL